MAQIDEKTLREIALAHPPDIGELTFRPIKTGKFNDSWFARGPDQEMVLRVAPSPDCVFVFYERDMMRQEPPLHALLRENTSAPVPRIIAYDDSHAVIGRDYLLMERLPGRPLTEVNAPDSSRVLRQVGAYLREAHEITAKQYGYLGPHHPMTPQSSWAEAFSIMWNRLIDDVVDVGHYTQSESAALRDALDIRMDVFERDVTSRLLHMDVWAQNILVDDSSGVTGLVDWDRALWGDPEIEYAVLDYCGISEPPFWEGYGRSRDTSAPAQTRRVFYLLYELQKYIVIRAGRNDDPSGARRYKGQVLEMARNQLNCRL